MLFSGLLMSVSLMRFDCQNFDVWPMFFFLNVICALEGSL